MKSLKVSRMNLQGVIKPVMIYYAIFITVATTIIISNNIFTGNTSMSGVEASTIIFLFVLGLNSFRNNFYFAKSNNVARKTFIKGLIISALPIAVVMSIIDIIINRITNIFIQNPTFYDMSYEGSFNLINYNLGQKWIQSNAFGDVLNTLLFHFSLCLVAYVAGIIVNMIYYRCNKVMKVVVSVTPVILIMYISSASYNTSSVISKIGKIISYLLGVNPVNVYAPVLTFLVTALILSAVSFLLIRKAVIKER